MANNKSTRKNKRPPSEAAVKWHELKEELATTIGSQNETLRLIAGYVQVFRREDFRNELQQEELLKLTESLNVVRVCAETLKAAIDEATNILRAETSKHHTARDWQVFDHAISELNIGFDQFGSNAGNSGHLDNVNNIIQAVSSRLDTASTPSDETVKETDNV